MKKVGFLAAAEEPFIGDMINNIIQESHGEVEAELCEIPELRIDKPVEYNLIIDRISHVMPYYLQYAKQAMLNGTYVINNPFRFYVEKYFGYAAAKQIGVPVPKTVLLPPKTPPKDMEKEDLINLAYPLDWKEILSYVGLPAYFKPASGWGWRDVYKVNSFDELMHHYDKSGTELMILQENIEYDHYVRCFCIGRKYTMPIKYRPDAPFHEQYVIDHDHLTKDQGEQVCQYSKAISDVLDFDMNVCEFAFRKGEPVAIDFTNMVPDTNPDSIKQHYYDWVIDTLTKTVLEYLDKKPVPGIWKSAERIFCKC